MKAKNDKGYYNQAGNGNAVGNNGLINIEISDLEKIVAEAKAAGHNQACVSFRLWQTENGRYIKGGAAGVAFPPNTKPGAVSIKTSEYNR